MKIKWVRGLLLICSFSIIFSLAVSATYVDDGSIVLVRSQFLNDTIEIDGQLSDSSWSKSGTMIVSFSNPETFTLEISYLNVETELYVGISLEVSSAQNHSFLLSFDVDGDGFLNAPEDAKYIDYTGQSFTPRDYHWDGDNWVVDGLFPGGDSEFETSSSFNNDEIIHEMKIALTSSNTQFDGFRIANPTNSFIGFNTEFSRNNGSAVNYYNFPVNPKNSSGYVDLKLAGPEDNDLPEYSPPTTQVTAEEPSTTQVTEAIGALSAPFPVSGGMTIIFLILYTIRRKYR